MAKRANSKAAKIRALLAERPNGKPATTKASGYESLIQAKQLTDAMGGVEKARAALDVLAKLV